MIVLAVRDGSPLPVSTAFLIVLGLVLAMVAVSGLRRVGASERLVVRRFGRTRGVRGPGLRFLLPLADTGVRVPMGARPHHLWFRAMTRDGVPLQVKAHALMGADDPVRYAEAADAPSSAAQAGTEFVLRGLIADRDLADLPSLLADGDDPELVRRVNEAVRPWGVAASLVSITDATVPVRSAPASAAPASAAPASAAPVTAAPASAAPVTAAPASAGPIAAASAADPASASSACGPHPG